MIDVTDIIVYHNATILTAARWQSGYAAVCKTVYIGSIPVRASIACAFFSYFKKPAIFIQTDRWDCDKFE